MSPGILLNRVRGAFRRDAEDVRVLGVDDFAFRRDNAYGTILVDLERRRVVDLLPECSQESLASWLRRNPGNPGVEVATRDRSRIYREGIAKGAPDATQVADRWHLLRGLALGLEELPVSIVAAWARHARTTRQGPRRGVGGRGRHAGGCSTPQTGVTKMTFYAHFASKDELVAAYLTERDARWRGLLEGMLAGYEAPEEKLLAVFDAYRESVVSQELRVCAFVNFAAEFPDRERPARRVAIEHKAGLRRRLVELSAEAGAEVPEALAEGLFVLLEGAYVTAALEGDGGVVDRARRLAENLISAAVATAGPRG